MKETVHIIDAGDKLAPNNHTRHPELRVRNDQRFAIALQ
jgi:hypothetical protein